MENDKLIKMFKFTAFACMLASSTNTMALGPNANVQINGTIKPGACTPTLDNGGVIDLGVVDANSIGASGLRITDKSFNLVINCSTHTVFEWDFTDNRFDSAVTTSLPGLLSSWRNGLGFTSDNKKIGAYNINRSSRVIVADGINRDLIQFNGVWSITSGANAVMQSTNMGTNALKYSVAETGEIIPIAVKTASFPLYARMAISSEMNSVTQIENIDGNVTFSLEYL